MATGGAEICSIFGRGNWKKVWYLVNEKVEEGRGDERPLTCKLGSLVVPSPGQERQEETLA